MNSVYALIVRSQLENLMEDMRDMPRSDRQETLNDLLNLREHKFFAKKDSANHVGYATLANMARDRNEDSDGQNHVVLRQMGDGEWRMYSVMDDLEEPGWEENYEQRALVLTVQLDV